MKNYQLIVIAISLNIVTSSLLASEDHHSSMDHHATEDMNQNMSMQDKNAQESKEMGVMEHERMSRKATMDHSSHNEMLKTNKRNPHAFSDGYGFGPIKKPRLADEHNFGSMLVDRLETVKSENNTAATYDLQAWYGRDYNKLVIKAEGDFDDKELEETSTDLVWGHAISAFWDTQLGIRYDTGENDNLAWLAFGIQGLAPYWFEMDITGYFGEGTRTALNIEAEYELLFTQKLILQPRVEAALYGKDDNARNISAGLDAITTGLRLRYEFFREFAPYVGIEWTGKLNESNETKAVAGARFWF